MQTIETHQINIDEAIQVSCIIDKLPPSWKDFKHTLKHLKEELTLVELGSHLRIKESLKAHDSDKSKGNNVVGPQLNIVNDMGKSAFMSTFKLNDSILWHVRLSHVYFKRMQNMSKDGLIPPFDMNTEKWNKKYFVTFIDDASRAVVRLPNLKLITLGERGIECIFVGYVEHSNAFRFYVIEPNESVSIKSIIESGDAIFDENRFSSVLGPSQRSLINGIKEIGSLLVPEEVTEEVVTQQPEHDLIKKVKGIGLQKNFRPEFQLYLIVGTRDEVSDQHSYCFNVRDDTKTFDEAMKSWDVAFWKEAINNEMDFILGNNTWVLVDLPPGCKPLGCKWIFKRKLKVDGTIEKFKARLMDVKTTFLNGELDKEVYMNQPQGFIMPDNKNKVDLTKEFLSSRFSIKDMKEPNKFNYFDCTSVSTPMDTSEKLVPNNGHVVSQLEYSRVIKCLMYAMTCTRPDIAFAVGKLSRYTSNHGTQHWQAIQRVLKYLTKTMDYSLTYTGYPSVLEGYIDASWTSNTKDNLSTSGWVFLFGGGVISWASRKQTCITGSTMKSKFVALAAGGNG
ncbi:zinc finger, CCHC-type containing protein [Tanacetum coccineum]